MRVKTNPTRCLRCRVYIDGATLTNFGPGERPKDGDISICLACGAVAAFTDTMTLRALRPEELEQIKNIPSLVQEIQDCQEKILATRVQQLHRLN